MQKQYSIKASASSKANNSADKPYEDSYLLDEDNHIYIVADGVTRDRIEGKYPNPSPAKQVSELFVKEVHKQLLQNMDNRDISQRLRQASISANQLINIKNRSYTDFAPGTVAIVALIENNQFHYLHIGDCSLYRLGDDIQCLTIPQTKLIDEHRDAFTTSQVRNEIANNANHPYGYGVLNGDEDAQKFMEYHQFELTLNDKILIASDGLDALLKESPFSYKNQSPDDLIEAAEKVELQNPQLRSDDKTAIMIKVF